MVHVMHPVTRIVFASTLIGLYAKRVQCMEPRPKIIRNCLLFRLEYPRFTKDDYLAAFLCGTALNFIL